MRLIILTSLRSESASIALEKMIRTGILPVLVVFNEGKVSRKKNFIFRKLRKVYSIGLLGALNGIRMRQWFGDHKKKYLSPADIEELCARYQIRFETTPEINCEHTLKLFESAGADLAISLGNSFIGKKIFSKPRLGMINIHGEVLPDYQNAQSIIWQIYNNSPVTGYTIHKITRQIDHGDILYQQSFPIVFRNTLADTVAYNCAVITDKASDGLVHLLMNLDDYWNDAKPQSGGKKYTTPSWKEFQKMKKNFQSLKTQNTIVYD